MAGSGCVLIWSRIHWLFVRMALDFLSISDLKLVISLLMSVKRMCRPLLNFYFDSISQ